MRRRRPGARQAARALANIIHAHVTYPVVFMDIELPGVAPGVTSSSASALMWQWSGGGGVRNAIGDFDQIDASRQA